MLYRKQKELETYSTISQETILQNLDSNNQIEGTKHQISQLSYETKMAKLAQINEAYQKLSDYLDSFIEEDQNIKNYKNKLIESKYQEWISNETAKLDQIKQSINSNNQTLLLSKSNYQSWLQILQNFKDSVKNYQSVKTKLETYQPNYNSIVFEPNQTEQLTKLQSWYEEITKIIFENFDSTAPIVINSKSIQHLGQKLNINQISFNFKENKELSVVIGEAICKQVSDIDNGGEHFIETIELDPIAGIN